MNPWTDIIQFLILGIGLGLFFFGGLLWTVKQIPASSRPGLLVGTSFVIRQVVTVALLVLACRDHWERWGAAMAGFLIIRTLLMKTQQADMKRKRT